MADKNPDKDQDIEQDLIFKEVDEELRQDKHAKLWAKYGNTVLAACGVLVLSVAGFQGWKTYDINRKTEDSALFASAMRAVENGKADQAAGILAKLATEGTAGYAVLARFNQAALMVKKSNLSAAAAAYYVIANDTGIDREFRDLALVLSALHGVDNGDPNILTQRLADLLGSASPWRFSAKEITALLASRMGDKAKAGKLFKELADDASAPSGIRARAAEMTAIFGG